MLLRQPAAALPPNAPRRPEPREPPRPPPEATERPTRPDDEVWPGLHAGTSALSKSPAWADPDAGDGRHPRSPAPREPVLRSPAPREPARMTRPPMGQTTSEPATRQPGTRLPAPGETLPGQLRMRCPADRSRMFASEPSPAPEATRPKGWQPATYRVQRQDGRQAEVRDDDAAYGQTRSEQTPMSASGTDCGRREDPAYRCGNGSRDRLNVSPGTTPSQIKRDEPNPGCCRGGGR